MELKNQVQMRFDLPPYEIQGRFEMKALNVHETKTNLSSILAQVETKGERFTICRNGKPIADLIPHQTKSRLEPDPFLSKVKVKCDLTAPLTQEDWKLD